MKEEDFEGYREKFQALMQTLRIAEIRAMRQSLETLQDMTNLQRLLIISDLLAIEFKKTHDPYKADHDQFDEIIEQSFPEAEL